jgi:hypothetical protein
VTDSQVSPTGNRKASAVEDLATRSKNWTATFAGIVSTKLASWLAGMALLAVRRVVRSSTAVT